MSFNRQLRWTDGSEGIDHPEPVSSSRGDGEDFEWCIGHETGVGVPELTFAVDEATLGVLSSVHGQSSRETLRGIFVHPIAEEHDVCRQVVVVEVAVGVSGWGLADHDATVETVHFLQTRMGVPEVSTGVSCDPLVSNNSKQHKNIVLEHWEFVFELKYLKVFPCWMGHCVTKGTPS